MQIYNILQQLAGTYYTGHTVNLSLFQTIDIPILGTHTDSTVGG